MDKSRSGFTIVELLIVIVVIAILAAISVVAYTGIQNRAENSKTITGVSEYLKILESYKVINGSYPTTPLMVPVLDQDTVMVFVSRIQTVQLHYAQRMRPSVRLCRLLQLLYPRYRQNISTPLLARSTQEQVSKMPPVVLL